MCPCDTCSAARPPMQGPCALKWEVEREKCCLQVLVQAADGQPGTSQAALALWAIAAAARAPGSQQPPQLFGSVEGLAAALQWLLSVLQVSQLIWRRMTFVGDTKIIICGPLTGLARVWPLGRCGQHPKSHKQHVPLQAVSSDAAAASAAAGALGAIVTLHQGRWPATPAQSPSQPRAAGV